MFGRRLIPFLLFAFLLAGCASGGGAAQPTAPVVATGGAPLTKVTLYMGYIPNVQFAPFYLAQQKGYYRDEGIDLSFDYGMENDLMQLLATDKAQFAIGSGDQVILGRSQGLPLVYVMNWYRKYPVAVFSLLPLKSPQDLKGKTVVFYCSVGVRSSALAESVKADLLAAGTKEVVNLEGGIFGWHNQSRPLVDKSGPTTFVHPYNAYWGRLLTRPELARTSVHP